jgi:glycosyltransferase involved in cell wall biosynthesis
MAMHQVADYSNGRVAGRPERSRRPRVAYIMSRFPKLTETFVLYEILAMEKQDVDVEIYPLRREAAAIVHAEALPLIERAHYTPFISPEILAANLHFLRRRPRRYLGLLVTLIRANLGSGRYLAGVLAYFPKAAYLARHLATRRIDHIHAHFASHPAMVAFVIHRLTGIPYSFTAHGSDIHRDQHMLREKVAEASVVVTISEYNRRFILEHVGEAQAGRLQVIHTGVDTTAFWPPAALHDAVNGWPLEILCIGTLHEVKGQKHLIAAIALLRQRGIPVTCAFIGDGPDRAMLERLAAEAGLAGHIRFLGRLTQAEIRRHLQEADALVAPSVPSSDGRREGIPVALMEAMACGLPVVASRLSGIPELVEDGRTGLLAEPGSPADLARALEQLYGSPALRGELGRAARAKVMTDFDLHQNAARLAHYMRESVR